jgi:hypothetical protein
VGSAACAAIVPTRGRPGGLSQLLDDFTATAVCTDLIVCLDDDDPALDQYKVILSARRFARHTVCWHAGPRDSLAGWTNRIAGLHAADYEAVITLGDDHRPQTPAWDRKLLDAARAMGGGWAYGDDGVEHQDTPEGWVTSQLPSAFLVSTTIVAALGWVMLPGCQHMYVDAAARDLGLATGRLAWLPEVKVRHDHYTTGRSARDATYEHGQASWAADEAAYRAWLGDPAGTGPICDDAETVREALR